MDTGKIPKAWQLSTVIAILKGKEESIQTNNTNPQVSKILEIVVNQILPKKKVLMLIISL